MNQLSDCVLLRIFKLLQSSNQQLWRVRLVCKRWYVLLADSELWRVCNLSKFNLNNYELFTKAFQYLPLDGLQYVEITKNKVSVDVLELLLEQAINLRGLRLKKCKMSKRDSGKNGKHQNMTTTTTTAVTTSQQLEILDIRKCYGDLKFLETCIINNYSNLKVLGLPSDFGAFTQIKNQSFLTYLPNLTILECLNCQWMNDDAIEDISKYCKQLVSLSVEKCLNVLGSTIPKLVNGNTTLKTLILRRTSIQNNFMDRTDWSNSHLIELDLSHCYFLPDVALDSQLVHLITRLEYFRGALTDSTVSSIMDYNLNFRTLEVTRRHPLNIENVAIMLSNCSQVTALDISITPLDYRLMQNVIPKLTTLRWLSIAGHNETLKTPETINLLTQYCPNIEVLGISFYNIEINQAFKVVLKRSLFAMVYSSQKLQKICLAGGYTREIISEMQEELTNRGITSCVICQQIKDFELPSPRLSVNALQDRFSCNSSTTHIL